MKILLDAMGGDNAPNLIIEGALMAIKELDVEIVLLGNENQILNYLTSVGEKNNKNITIINCLENISFEDEPVKAIRRKKDSSLVKGLNMLKNHEGDAFVSAGSTGALLAGGLFIVGRIRGIDRPALSGIYPTENGGSLLLDIGANADCKVKNLDEFAVMGSIYAQTVLNIQNPKVGLINIGSEESKGNELYKAAFQEMKKNKNYNFIGNIEAKEILLGRADVLVCDGFTGNVILKLTEGVAKSIFSMIKSAIMSNMKTKLAGTILKPSLKKLNERLDADEHGGAPLLGLNGIVIKAHGSSNGKAIKNAIKQAKSFYENHSIEKIITYANANQK